MKKTVAASTEGTKRIARFAKKAGVVLVKSQSPLTPLGEALEAAKFQQGGGYLNEHDADLVCRELIALAVPSKRGMKLCADCGCEFDCLKYGCEKNFQTRNAVLDEAIAAVEKCGLGDSRKESRWQNTRRYAEAIRALKKVPPPFSPTPNTTDDYKALYMELIYAVAKKHPGESRHETALRYIRERENMPSNPAQAPQCEGSPRTLPPDRQDRRPGATSMRHDDKKLRELHDRLGSMIAQVGHPDYSLRELIAGLREVQDELFAVSSTAAPAVCQWISDDDGVWHTGCKNAFTFIDAGPEENSMKFCCYCGGTLFSRADGGNERQT